MKAVNWTRDDIATDLKCGWHFFKPGYRGAQGCLFPSMKKLHSFSGLWLVPAVAAGWAWGGESNPAKSQKTLLPQPASEMTKCATLTEAETEEQSGLIRQMHLREKEMMAKREADLAEIADDKALLDSGDLSPISKAVVARDVKRLWLFFELARVKGARAFQTELNERIFELTRQGLASIPGHAVLLGDEVERLSSDPKAAQQRSSALRCLGELGSMEAIQQIARFISDPRNPAAATADHGRLLPIGLMGRANFFYACQALQQALGDKSPLRDEAGRAKKSEWVEGDDFDLLPAWWKSEAAKRYREWTYDQGAPLLHPRPMQHDQSTPLQDQK
ncbi:hypothetical protein [Prosthecobacter sp.]|uniref:hypothetical protein n=1 Tax=Prosthecobacter sp. TaxID=1965333 RepID=UPI003783AB4A